MHAAIALCSDSVQTYSVWTSPLATAGWSSTMMTVAWSPGAGSTTTGSTAQLLHEQADQKKQQNNLLIFALMMAFVAFLLVNYLLIYRNTLTSISNLQVGVEIIGSGNLDYSIVEKSGDEIGELSHAFNQMTANLKTVTASKSDLEKEMADRAVAEEALMESEQRYRSLFSGMTEGFALHEIICGEEHEPYDYRFLDVNPAFERSWIQAAWSFAAPFVAAACALLDARAARYARPLDGDAARELLKQTARPFPREADSKGCGAGILDVPAALRRLESDLNSPNEEPTGWEPPVREPPELARAP